MTLDEYKQWKPILAAWEDGELQERVKDQWFKCDSIDFSDCPASYRRKPKAAKIYVRLCPNGSVGQYSALKDFGFSLTGPTLEFEDAAPLREQIKVLREALVQVHEWANCASGVMYPTQEVESALKFEP